MSFVEAADCSFVIAVGVGASTELCTAQNGRYLFGFEDGREQRELERRAVRCAEWSDGVCLVRSEVEALVLVNECSDPGAWRLSGGT